MTNANDASKTRRIADKPDSERARMVTQLPPDELEPFFELSSKGLGYVGVTTDRNTGAKIHTKPVKLAGAFEIKGTGEDDDGYYYRILEFRANASRKMVRMAFPLAVIGERSGWAQLRGKGLEVTTNLKRLDLLADYLQTEGSKSLHQILNRGGWHHNAYFLPSGEMIGEPDRPLFFQGDNSAENAYAARGDVEHWRDSVARLALGNSRPMLAIGCAFAAPLLGLVGMESGGVHLYGDSGAGKTTTAHVGASVWGNPDEQRLNWDSTAYALSMAAAARNDGLMILDEVSQGAADAVSQSLYRLFNGKGKMQGAKDGGNRKPLSWRVLALSTGETPLDVHLKNSGQRIQAGQEVRLVSIPAAAGRGLGAFEVLHEFATAGALAEALERASFSCCGVAGRSFVEAVAERREEVRTRLNHAIGAWLDELPPEISGQARRIARRFALIGEALELATDFGITGWAKGDGLAAVKHCFNEVLRDYGTDKQEDREITERTKHFLISNAHSRFHRLRAGGVFDSSSSPRCAGYIKEVASGEEFLVFTEPFRTEISEGFSHKKVADVLLLAGMLIPDSKGDATQVKRVPVTGLSKSSKPLRFYCLRLGDDDQEQAERKRVIMPNQWESVLKRVG